MRRLAGLRPFALPLGVTLGLTAWVCAGSWGWSSSGATGGATGGWGAGWFLYRDFVAVPEPRLGPQSLGVSGAAARAVPLDAVTTALALVVPTSVQQQLMLAGVLVLAGLGVAVLLRAHGTVAMACGAAVAVWNPYVAERLLLGQPPTLLAYSMAPWIVLAVRHPGPAGRRLALVVLAALPAALTPFGGVVAAVVAVAASLATPARRTRGWLASVLVVAFLWCLPWLAAATTGPGVVADRDGAIAFAVGADSPLGTVGSVLMLGGAWAPGARPSSRLDLLPVLASLAILLLAAAGVLAHARRGRRRAAVVLATLYAGPVCVVLLLSTGPGLALFTVAQDVPGVAIFRDTHRLLGLSALVCAVGVGLAAGALTRWFAARPPAGGRGPSAAPVFGAGLVVLALTVLTVPDLPGLVARSYRPVAYPPSWQQVVDAVESTPGDGAVLVLPWQPFRNPAWAGGQPFLDPLPRALDREVLSSFDLTVARDDRALVVGGGDPAESRAWAAGRLDPAVLDRLGISVVVEWQGTAGRLPSSHAGLVAVLRSPEFTVWSRRTG
ncbi:hypothetical protein GCM10009867_01070 [Pedococcus aerophilus]|uniref:Glycosyltransferase RgtA/B/C/D-like domain-containing protein n=1 Tax=Pedococcus aerophilus TaxID=436356 RepID=A0ABP6GUX9_9MICO